MLTQHSNYVPPKRRSVKLLTSIMALATVTAAPMAAQASPSLDNIVRTKHAVKFDRALFTSEDGLQQVYTTLVRKAEKACKIGTSVDDEGTHLSKAECVSDLLDQFVENADVTVLTAYHSEQGKAGG